MQSPRSPITATRSQAMATRTSQSTGRRAPNSGAIWNEAWPASSASLAIARLATAPRGSRSLATAAWAYEELAALGFCFDSSECAWPPNPRRQPPVREGPYRLRLPSGAEMWELPVPVWRAGRVPLPVAGGASWRLLPSRVLLRALRRVHGATAYPTLYFHPCEWDPQPLRSSVPRSAGRLRQVARSGVVRVGRARKVHRRVDRPSAGARHAVGELPGRP